MELTLLGDSIAGKKRLFVSLFKITEKVSLKARGSSCAKTFQKIIKNKYIISGILKKVNMPRKVCKDLNQGLSFFLNIFASSIIFFLLTFNKIPFISFTELVSTCVDFSQITKSHVANYLITITGCHFVRHSSELPSFFPTSAASLFSSAFASPLRTSPHAC